MMFCRNCGAEVPDNSKFCPSCQASQVIVPLQEAAPARKGGKGGVRLLLGFLCGVALMLVIGVLLWRFAAPQGGKNVEGKGFDSPEAAVEGYLTAFRDGDVDKMMSTFVAESFFERLDFHAYLEMINTYTPTPEGPSFMGCIRLPSDQPFTKELNVAQWYGWLSDYIFYQYVFLVQPDLEIIQPQSVSDTDIVERLDKLADEDTIALLGALKIGDFLESDAVEGYDAVKDLESFQEEMRAQKRIFGYDELQPVGVEVEVGGKNYWFFMDTACYNGRWYNLSPGGTMGGFVGANSGAGVGFIPAP